MTSSSNPAVFGFSETWLDETITDDEIKIQGYVLERKDRNRLDGGVSAYFRKDLVYNRRFAMETPDLEVLPIDLFLPKTKPILSFTCYRPPKDTSLFTRLENAIFSSTSFYQ